MQLCNLKFTVRGLLLMVLCVATTAICADEIKFQNDFAKVFDETPVERPTVVTFGSIGCGWCRKMMVTTFTDESVTALADDYFWMKIDTDEQPDIAALFGIRGVPATFLLDQEGRLLGGRTGYLSPEQFLDFLEQSKSNPAPQQLESDMFAQRLRAAEGEDLSAVVLELLDRLAQPPRPDRKRIVAELAKKGRVCGPILLEKLADQRLSVRAAAAETLRITTGGQLPFNAFAAADTRQQQMDAWREWLKQQ